MQASSLMACCEALFFLHAGFSRPVSKKKSCTFIIALHDSLRAPPAALPAALSQNSRSTKGSRQKSDSDPVSFSSTPIMSLVASSMGTQSTRRQNDLTALFARRYLKTLFGLLHQIGMLLGHGFGKKSELIALSCIFYGARNNAAKLGL